MTRLIYQVMTEQSLQKKIIDYLNLHSYYVVKTVVTNKSGVPDIIACSPSGKFVAIEVKAPGKLSTVSPIQQYNLDSIVNTNGIAFAADNLSTVKKYLENI